MKGNRLWTILIGLLLASSAWADSKNKIIYKWQSDGKIYYSHLKPPEVKDYEKMDEKGRQIVEFSEEFDEIIDVNARPDTDQENNEPEKEVTSGVAGSKEIAAEVEAVRVEKVRQENCETAKKNMTTINSGEVYERDDKGNMMRLSNEQIESKRQGVQKDLDYFCSPQ